MRKLLIIFTSIFLVFSFSTSFAVTPKKWTFMIFMNGNNNLDPFSLENLKAMEQVGSNDEVNIVVQWASLSSQKVVRILVQKSSDPSRVTSPIVEDLGSVDMGNYHTLKDFIAWTVKNYPAEHYFIDVWNHGSGWRQKRFAGNKDISWDDLTGNSITTEQLGRVMEYASQLIGHKVDIYGSDACLMGMIEVANEMSESVEYFVGSQELEPGSGWPYADFLYRWEKTPAASADQIAKILVDAYVKSYQNGSNGDAQVTFSAYHLPKLAALNKALTQLGADLRQLSPEERAKVLAAIDHVQSFGFPDYGDLIDFTKNLAAANLKGLQAQDITNVQAAASEVIIANAVTDDYVRATGMSIWLPADHRIYDSRSERYRHLEFNLNTKWGETLDAVLQGVYPDDNAKRRK